MRLVHLHPGPDTGGQSMAGKAVLEAAGHEVRVFVHAPHPFGYAPAEKWDDELVAGAVARADAVVIHNDPMALGHLARGRVIVHHHGSRFRGDPLRIWKAAEEIGARQIVSTVDLLLSVPAGERAEWIPQVVDTEYLATFDRRAIDGRTIITHAPTNKSIKGTRHVIRAMRHLRGEAEVDIIMRRPWRECLTRKARSDIFVDQLNLGYGNNAIEAWALGLPVLAGAAAPILDLMRRTYDIPFHVTDADSLLTDLRAFIADRDLRDHWASVGLRHVERFHAPEAWRVRAEEIYFGIPAEKAA